LLVLSGAGVSTDSGIPDYRDAEGAWKRAPPTLYDEFVRSPQARKRYWARSMLGWPHVAKAQPNGAHYALARLEALGHLSMLLTQNVDGLHGRAGSSQVIELHGSLGRVDCLDCGSTFAREMVQRAMIERNPAFAHEAFTAAPDGDAFIERGDIDAFDSPACPQCGGMLKPGVVFFGENVPRARVDAAFEAMSHSDALLVVGSSLMVYSGFRFCERARIAKQPIAAINLGRTRADSMLSLKIEASCAPALHALIDALERR
jgi:NAD-dependent SIR2 family protein deacetylase